MDDKTYQRAQVQAAEAGTSISATVREFLNRNENQKLASEAQRIAALEAWYVAIDKCDSKASEPVKPFTRKEIYATRIR